MKKKKRWYIYIVIIIVLGNVHFGFSKSNNPEIIELRLKSSFPVIGKQDWYLALPMSMEMDEKNNIFIADIQQSVIFHIDQKGKLIKKIGRVGKGPGDLLTPIAIYCNRDTVYVSDSMNHWIKWFDINGNYINGFKVLYPAYSICKLDNKIYTSIVPRDKTGVKNFVFVYNKKGKLINKFGEFLDFVPNLSNIISRSLLINHNNKLYVLFANYPILRVYSPEGELLRELTLNETEYRKKIPDNYKWDNFKKRNGAIRSPVCLFSSFYITDNYIFVQLGKDHIIDQFDFSGNLVRRFIIPDATESYIQWSFQLIKKDCSEYTFFISNIDSQDINKDAPHIDVYTAKLK